MSGSAFHSRPSMPSIRSRTYHIHRVFAELAVVYDVDPGLLLAGDNLGNRRAQFWEHVRRPLPTFRHGLRQFLRPLERPNVGGKDPVSAPLHVPSMAPLPRAPQ